MPKTTTNKAPQKKKGKKITLFLFLLLIIGAGSFGFYKYKEAERAKENYNESVESYLFFEIDEIQEQQDKKTVYNYEEYDKEWFLFKEASESLENVFNEKEFLFLLDYEIAEDDAASFLKFLKEELDMEIASSVSNIDSVYKLENGNIEIISNNFYYSKYNDSKTLEMKFATVIDADKREIISINGAIENLVFQENNNVHRLKQEEVTTYMDYLDSKKIEVKTIENQGVIVEEGENETITEPQDKTIDEFTEFLNKK